MSRLEGILEKWTPGWRRFLEERWPETFKMFHLWWWNGGKKNEKKIVFSSKTLRWIQMSTDLNLTFCKLLLSHFGSERDLLTQGGQNNYKTSLVYRQYTQQLSGLFKPEFLHICKHYTGTQTKSVWQCSRQPNTKKHNQKKEKKILLFNQGRQNLTLHLWQ